MIKSIITVVTHNHLSLNFTGASTELNPPHMVPPFRHLGGDRALSYSGLSDHGPPTKRKKTT